MPKKPAKPADVKPAAPAAKAAAGIDVYTHDEHSRPNIPPVGPAGYDTEENPEANYAYDPNIDPSLQWAGKQEGTSFAVPTSSIHVHEVKNPMRIIQSVRDQGIGEQEVQPELFESDVERMKRRSGAIAFYRHKDRWTNRLIAGDSLVIMNSLLARELLADSGSVFVQISDENVHHIREICDELFGAGNFVAAIVVKTRSTSTAKYISSLNDFVIWYCKSIDALKYHQLFESKEADLSRFNFVEINGEIKNVSTVENALSYNVFSSSSLNSTSASGNPENQEFEFNGKKYHPAQSRSWRCSLTGLENLKEAGRIFLQGDSLRYKYYYTDFPFVEITNLWTEQLSEQNKDYVVQTATKVVERCLLMTTDPSDLVLDITCGSGTTAYVAEQWGRRWITCDTSRIAITLAKKRLMTAVFPWYKIKDHKTSNKTNINELKTTKIRDNSRPFVDNINDSLVSNGFIYKTVPHITLKSIANNEPPEEETLYDQPEIDKKKMRVSGPFTVEALPAPVGLPTVKPPDSCELRVASDETNNSQLTTNYSNKLSDWMEELRASGVRGKGGAKIEFSRVELLEGGTFLHATAETMPQSIVKGDLIDDPSTLKQTQRAVICFAGENYPLDVRMVEHAMSEAENIRPKPSMLIFAVFQFDPTAAKTIDDTTWPGLTLLKVQMNIDLQTSDLKKNRSSNQSFWLIGQPDVELIKLGNKAFRAERAKVPLRYREQGTGASTKTPTPNSQLPILQNPHPRL